MFDAIKHLYPQADIDDFSLQDDGDGIYISYWNTEKLGEQPEKSVINAVVIPPKTTLEVDTEKYLRRAQAKPLLMAEMAAMNIGRLKDGTWQKDQLIALMADTEIKLLVSHMETLSFKPAIDVANGLTNPMVTPEIKAAWVAKLEAYL